MTAIVAWVAVISGVYFVLMNYLKILRVPLLEEIIGLDIAEMGSAIHISKKVEDNIIMTDSIRKSSNLMRGGSIEKMRDEFGAAGKIGAALNDEPGDDPSI